MQTISAIPAIPSQSFVRNLNLLLKIARLYGLRHKKMASQLESTWVELRVAIDASASPGLVLATSGGELLLDGIPLESTPAERSLVQLLSSSGIVSIVFTPELKKESFARFVRNFADAGVKPGEVLTRLKSAFGNGASSGIRINEIRFVPADALAFHSVFKAQLNAQAQVAEAEKTPNWLRDPEKLIEVLAAAQSHGRSKTSGFIFGEALLGVPHHPSSISEAAKAIDEAEMAKLVGLVGELRDAARREIADGEGAEWQSRLTNLSASSQVALREALEELSGKIPSKTLDDAGILRLGEELLIRYALERFASGEISASAVRELLGRLGGDVESLRDRIYPRKGNGAKSSLSADSYTDVLHRQFWAALAEPDKRSVLLSNEAWCVPTPNLEQYVEELLRRCDSAGAEEILANYARNVRHHQVEARKKAAAGLDELADLYARTAGPSLDEAVKHIGEQLAVERDAEVQTLLAAAFVRFTHEATARRSFPAVRQALDTLASLDRSMPTWTKSLRPRIGITNRIPEFIEHGLQAEETRPELLEVLCRVPQLAADTLAQRLIRVTRLSEREALVEMASGLGQLANEHLRKTLESSPLEAGIRVIGLLSRVDPEALEKLLPEKIQPGELAAHDEILHQLSIAGAPERGRVLIGVLGRLDARILPLALDEIGMCGDKNLSPQLLQLSGGDLLRRDSEFLRVKALEALGRLRDPLTEERLVHFVEARRAWRWKYPSEMRLAAGQALQKLDPDLAQAVLGQSGLDPQLLASHSPLDARPGRDFVRYRRYPRIRMTRPVPAVIQSRQAKYQPAVQVLSLDGGLLAGELQLAVGTPAELKIASGMRSIHLEVLVRFSNKHQAGVEMVGMDLEDRSRLRNLIVSMVGASPEPSPLAA
jgi:PilZ domain